MATAPIRLIVFSRSVFLLAQRTLRPGILVPSSTHARFPTPPWTVPPVLGTGSSIASGSPSASRVEARICTLQERAMKHAW